MVTWTNKDVLKALGVPSPEWQATGISIDSRTLKPGDLFIAIRGPAFDGHHFVEEAFNKGAVAAIVGVPVDTISSHRPQILVKDTLLSLQQLGRYSRSRSSAKIIAITGSVGKTSTKEMLRQLLEEEGPTAYSPATYNNYIGVPLSLASMGEDAKFGVFEVGMNHKGEIAPLAQMIQPHIAVITRIGEAHLEFLDSTEEVALEKAEIFSGFVPGGPEGETGRGIAILNRDDPFFDRLSSLAQARGASRVMSFGKDQRADVQLLSYSPNLSQGPDQGSHITAKIDGQEVSYTLSAPGEHAALNSLIALAVTSVWGLDWEKGLARLAALKPVDGRGAIHVLPLKGGKITLIDDAYNANPLSMRAGLAVLGMTPTQGRRIAVLGAMGELGPDGPRHHRELAPAIEAAVVDIVFATGPLMRHLYDTLPLPCRGGYADVIQDLLPSIQASLNPGDTVFVKGSKSTQVSIVVQSLKDMSTSSSLDRYTTHE